MDERISFWGKSKTGKVQLNQGTYLKDYEDFYLRKIKFLKNNGQIEKIAILGCGNGREIDGIIKIFNPLKIIGYDFSPELIDYARNRYPENNSVSFILADLTDSEFQIENNVDLVIISNNTLAYIVPLQKRRILLNKLNDSLITGGWLFFEVPRRIGSNNLKNMVVFFVFLFNYTFKKLNFGDRNIISEGYRITTHFFSKFEIRKMLDLSNFELIDVSKKSSFRRRKELHDTMLVVAHKLGKS
jgi:SAM-dependent methyltransferase